MAEKTISSKRSLRLPRWSWFILVPLIVIVLLILVLAALPVEADAELLEADWGVGANTVEPSWSGLLREWPIIDEAIDPALANLGYDLFFDPVMSGSNEVSCAHCHHPDLGFGDGRDLSVVEGEAETRRHAPTLWNVAYNTTFLWDGRAESLEDQIVSSMAAHDEMAQPLDELVQELAAIDDYAARFDDLFEDGVTAQNAAIAVAEFERTLISDGSAFDAYAGGDFDALTAQQRRGLGIFRSAATRCFECHAAPTFADESFRVLGVPPNWSDDRGRGEVEPGMDYAFRVPTLRNVALHAPYMHDGFFWSLEAVIDFYANGAGNGVGFDGADVDRFAAAGFDITPEETADLIAFLYALTDETIPERYWQGLDYIGAEGHILLPESVPSGLENVVGPAENPARETLAQVTAAPSERADCRRDAENAIVTVGEGQTIQEAVDCARPGDTVLVPPGVYHERVIVDQNGITLRGMADEPESCPVQSADKTFPEGDDAPDWPILDGDVDGDGERDLTDGVIASGSGFTMEYFVARNYTGNGVLVEGARGVTLRHLFTQNTGLYGVYPVRSENVLVECVVATLASDAAIYVGQSRDIVVRNNLAYDSVTGIEIENSVNADVYDNETWGNTGGILVFLLPNLHSRVSQDIQVHGNYIHDNNRGKSDATPGGIVNLVPIGTGILIMASDRVQVYNNTIENNDSFGIALTSLYAAFEEGEFSGVGPLSEQNRIYGNRYINNGTNPDSAVTDAGLSGADLLWDARGYGNTWDEPGASAFPPLLPGSGWPEFARRALFQVWNFVGKNM